MKFKQSNVNQNSPNNIRTKKNFHSFSWCFSVYSGTFDCQTAFEYNYGRKSKEVAICVIRSIT
nr:MAG TPA: hypothetical protein [Caudoviricetes sp.]